MFSNLYSCENKCNINLRHISAFCPNIKKAFPLFLVSILNYYLWFCKILYSCLISFFYSFSKIYSVHKFGPFPQVSSEAVKIISTAGFPAFYYAFKASHVLKSDCAIFMDISINTPLFLWHLLWLLMVSSFNIHNSHFGATKMILKLLTYLLLLLNFTVNFRELLSRIVSCLFFPTLSNVMLKAHLIHILW